MFSAQPSAVFQGVTNLGSFEEEFPQEYSSRLKLGFGASLIAGGLISFAVVLYPVLSGIEDPDKNTAMVFLFGGLAVLFGAQIILAAWRNWNLIAALYTRGFALSSRKGMHVVRWEEVTQVWQNTIKTRHYSVIGTHTSISHDFRLTLGNGQQLEITDTLARAGDLGKAIQERGFQVLHSRCASALKANQRVGFGPLSLDKNGLHLGEESLAWDENWKATLHQGSLSIWEARDTSKAWCTTYVRQIPNVFVLLHLLSGLGKFSAPASD